MTLRKEMGLRVDLPTAIVLFGGHGSKGMYEITHRLDAAGLPVQLLLICGRNEQLAAKMRARKWRMPVKVIGFCKEVHKLMRAAGFFSCQPAPGTPPDGLGPR